ncbi:Rieske 2Fe-2S domain-containing protein [Paraburkholderia elongata]|uniref:Rieske 2Fe-2S domain-containing protein n=1 Tax=Paraburkholderia elongata TaxID=2675747 RepID=A0A972SM96_9BURK|nr:Rieske 2Fe-2S domain-containing protein [Paraburkholderia elongata]NPT54914.1 Rieske 2Fe-2S domain-containing protein [Paraburkholderia elongata]NPT60943.1 Rieske 2Fe-2S domain-containing protein [Paraburkholderia elongata]
MLTKQDNELMCRTGTGTAMGDAMRRFWLPVIQSSDMPQANGEPQTIDLLGERFVVWRDQQGRPGLYAEGCLHRGASMQLARAEGDGLRCIYHGWKFAVDGTVLETPNVEDPKFKERIKGRTYPVQEVGGIVWGYLGPKGKEPPFPHWAFMDQPDSNRINACAVVNANFVQVIEGLVDSSHLTVLHSSALARTNDSNLDYAKKTSHMQFDAAPKIEADETDFGFHYVAIRQTGDKRIARVTSFIAPCFIANANGDVWLAIVPVSDERCNLYHVWWDAEKLVGEEPLRSEQLTFVGLDEPTLRKYGMTADTCDSSAAMSVANGYRQDRGQQRNGHFTGFDGITQEDAACSVSSGAIRDRSQEMLSTADLAISRLQRCLLAYARAARDQQEIAALRADAGSAIGVSGEIGIDEDWRTLVPHHRIVSTHAARAERSQ